MATSCVEGENAGGNTDQSMGEGVGENNCSNLVACWLLIFIACSSFVSRIEDEAASGRVDDGISPCALLFRTKLFDSTIVVPNNVKIENECKINCMLVGDVYSSTELGGRTYSVVELCSKIFYDKVSPKMY